MGSPDVQEVVAPEQPADTQDAEKEPADLSEQFISAAGDYLEAIEWQERRRAELVAVTGECDRRGYSHSVLAAKAGLSRTGLTKYAAEARSHVV